MEFFEAIACKTKKLKALRDIVSSLSDIDIFAARPGLTATSAAQRAACWLSELRALGLHMRAVDGRDVFFHTPAKSMLQERAQEAVLRKFGAYEPLELCYQATEPWGRFFIFDRFCRLQPRWHASSRPQRTQMEFIEAVD